MGGGITLADCDGAAAAGTLMCPRWIQIPLRTRHTPTIAEMARARGLGSILPEILPMMPMPRNARPAITNRLSRLISPNTFSQSLIRPPETSRAADEGLLLSQSDEANWRESPSV